MSNAGKLLHQKTMELLEKTRRYDQHGREMPQNLSYGQAFNIVIDENPDLTRRYADEMRAPRERTLAQQTDPKLIITRLKALIDKKMWENTEITFSEAFTEVQKEEPERCVNSPNCHKRAS